MQIILDTNSKSAASPTNLQISYFLFRVLVGVNLFFHGFMRVLTGVSAWEIPRRPRSPTHFSRCR